VSWLFSFWLGKLTEAALARNNADLLVQLRDKDCDAIEVKYHRSCYKSYTNGGHTKSEKVSLSNFRLLNYMFGLGHASH